jgi:hypothetical protein
MKSAIHTTFVLAALLATVRPASAETNTVTFDKPVSTYEWALKEINPDRPYDELVEAAKVTHARLLDIHLGKIPPTSRMAKTSEVGTPDEPQQLGVPAIQ